MKLSDEIKEIIINAKKENKVFQNIKSIRENYFCIKFTKLGTIKDGNNICDKWELIND